MKLICQVSKVDGCLLQFPVRHLAWGRFWRSEMAGNTVNAGTTAESRVGHPRKVLGGSGGPLGGPFKYSSRLGCLPIILHHLSYACMSSLTLSKNRSDILCYPVACRFSDTNPHRHACFPHAAREPGTGVLENRIATQYKPARMLIGQDAQSQPIQ